MKISPNTPCPCHSGRKYKLCCRAAHDGRPVETPEALMRSRYSAYALGLAEHIVATTHPAGPHWEADRDRWLQTIRRFCAEMRFEGLTVRLAETRDDRGVVEFEARMRQGERDATLVERSLFLREGGAWRYHSGARPPG